MALLAENAGEAIGVAVFNPCASLYPGRFAEITELYVRPGFRSVGIGRKLLEAAVAFCRSTRCNRLAIKSAGVARSNPRAADLFRSQCRARHHHVDHCRVSRRECACCWLLRPCGRIQPHVDSPEARPRVRPGYALSTNPLVPVLGDCRTQRCGARRRTAAHEYCRRSVPTPDSLQTANAAFCRGFEESGSLVESGDQRASRSIAVGGLFESRASIGSQSHAASH